MAWGPGDRIADMTRRQFAAASLATPLSVAQSPLARSRKPLNILWISCEDTSPTYGCYGDPYAVTPNLDKLAAEGTRYTHAFSAYPVCAPSRSSIITGMYPATIGSHHMRSLAVPPPEVRCFPEYLRAAGYYCTNNAKTDYNFEAPLTAWDESSNQAHWRNRERADQPFFAVFNLLTTHESQYRDPSQETQRAVERLSFRHDPAKAPVPPYFPDTPVVRRDLANYYDTVSAMDLQVADLLKQLDEDGLRDNTVVFHWGDHGWGLPRGKRWPYDSGTRVPLLVRGPGISAGEVNHDLVSLMDLGPTVLSLAGQAIPKQMQGVPFLGGAKAKAREYVFSARDRMDEAYDMMRAVRDHRFRYIRNYQPGKPYAQHIDYMELMPTMREMRRVYKESLLNGPHGSGGKLTAAQAKFFAPEKPREELYDSVADPHEIQNLAGDARFAQELARLRAVHEQFMRETGDLGEVPEAELVERMRPGGKWQVTAEPVVAQAGRTVTARCETAGASIAYTKEAGPRPRWKLYAAPVEVEPGQTLRFVACRIGYRNSPEVRLSAG